MTNEKKPRTAGTGTALKTASTGDHFTETDWQKGHIDGALLANILLIVVIVLLVAEVAHD